MECIRTAYQGQSFIPSGVGAKLVERISAPELSDRELQVLRLMANSRSNQEIGAALCITSRTL